MPFFSSGFPAQVVVSDGLSHLLHAELKVPKDRKDMFILSGDAQPMEVEEMYRLAGEILEALKAEGVEDVITLAAFVGDTKEETLGAASDTEGTALLKENNVPLLTSGAIGGLNGLLAGLAPLYGMRGFCLLGTSSGADPVDLGAAGNLLELINDLFKLDLDVTLMEPETEALEEDIQEEADMNYR